MPLVSTGELVSAARAEGRGIAAFNVITLEHAEAIATGVDPRKYLVPAREAMAGTVAGFLKLRG